MSTFSDLIKTADLLRPGYAASIGYDETGSLSSDDLPPHLANLFRYVKGTPHEIVEQHWMDLLPGHRLMLAPEILETRSRLLEFYGDDDLFHVVDRTPFMTNYSSDYYLVADDDTGVFWLDHSSGVSRVSANLETFFETILECYRTGAYNTGADGLLDMNDDLEQQVGLAKNPSCEHWHD